MDLIRMCLALSLCMTLMAHVVFSAPAFSDEEVETTDFQPDFDTGMALMIDDDSDDSENIYSRVRRQLGQLASGRQRYGSSRRPRYRGRLSGRRRYRNSRIGGGRVANY